MSDSLPLWIQPRGHRDEVIGLRQDAVAIRLTAPPVDGAANEEAIRPWKEKCSQGWRACAPQW